MRVSMVAAPVVCYICTSRKFSVFEFEFEFDFEFDFPPIKRTLL
jgi:hypothetical protein